MSNVSHVRVAFLISDKFSSTSAAWWKDEKGGSDSTKRDEKTADWLSSLKTNTSTSSLSSLDWGTTTSTASMSKNSSVEWSNPAMLSNLYKETSELTGASNTASIDWTQDGSTTASPGWDVSTAAAESAGGSKATVFETVTSTSSILSTTSATKPAQASLDLFPSGKSGASLDQTLTSAACWLCANLSALTTINVFISRDGTTQPNDKQVEI